MIAAHTDGGWLPVGIHQASWPEFASRFGFSARRRRLLNGLKAALFHLAEAGCASVVVGGSFVTLKANPSDVDVVWSVVDVNPDTLHPVFWTPDYRKDTKALFGAEFFPSNFMEADSGLTFTEYFQRSREFRAVGVVQIDLLTL